MMRMNAIGMLLTLALGSLIGNQPGYAQDLLRYPDKEIRPLLGRIVDFSGKFRDGAREDLREFGGGRDGGLIMETAEELRTAARRLRDDYRPDRPAAGDVEDLMRRAHRAERLVLSRPGMLRAKEAWIDLQPMLEKLAWAFHAEWGTNEKKGRPGRLSDREIDDRLDTIREGATRLRKEMDQYLRNDRALDWHTRDTVKLQMQEFEQTSKRMQGKIHGAGAGANELAELLRLGKSLHGHFRKNKFPLHLSGNWRIVQAELNDLADEYRLPRI